MILLMLPSTGRSHSNLGILDLKFEDMSASLIARLSRMAPSLLFFFPRDMDGSLNHRNKKYNKGAIGEILGINDALTSKIQDSTPKH